jgi:hypothetical protein
MNLPPPSDRWTIELANAERVNAIASFGFTERQARFLTNVLLHSGVFVERQYCSFASIVHGQKSTDFIKTLVERRFATPIATGKLHRGRMFHVHYKPLWAAVGEPDNRFRKPAAPGRMIERVMLLDAVLDDQRCTWLGPAIDKRRHFMRHLESRLEAREYPHLTFGDGPERAMRYFPDKFPIGVLPELDSHVFVYLVTHPSPMDFRLFLLRHVALFRVLFRKHPVFRTERVCDGHHVIARRSSARRHRQGPKAARKHRRRDGRRVQRACEREVNAEDGRSTMRGRSEAQRLARCRAQMH